MRARSCIASLFTAMIASACVSATEIEQPENHKDLASCAELAGESPLLRITKPGSTPLMPMDSQRTITQCKNELSTSPDDVELRFHLARAYLNNENEEEGLRLLTAAADAGHSPANILLGINFARKADKSTPRTKWLQYFERARMAGHDLADYFVIESKFIVDRDVELTEAEISEVRRTAEAGLGRAWFVLFYVTDEEPISTEKIEYLMNGDKLGHLGSTSFLAAMRYSGLKNATLIHRLEDRGAVYKQSFTRPGLFVHETIQLFEKVINYSPPGPRRTRATKRLVFTYLFAEGSENANAERAKELYCFGLDDEGRRYMADWKDHVQIPNCGT